MSRILLADDSPHAQRMGEYILREEGYEVVTVTDGETALVRLADVDPDLILADVLLPRKDGYQVCRRVKEDPGFQHTRVVLTAGALEPFDEEEARRVRADGNLRKPFEATLLLALIRPLLEAAELVRKTAPPAPVEDERVPDAANPAIDTEGIRAAVTLALDAALPTMIDEITQRVLVAFENR
jgi:CheY-like chemotaxis protein